MSLLLTVAMQDTKAQDSTTVKTTKKGHWWHPDSLVNRKLNFLPIPAASISPETGLRAGLVLEYFFNAAGHRKDSFPKTRDSYAYLEGMYSTRKQVLVESFGLMYTPGEKYQIRNRVGYVDNNERLWGFGNQTVGNKDYEKVRYSRWYLQTAATRQIKNQFFVGLNVNVSYTYNIDETIKDTNFLAGQPGETGSRVIGLGPTIIWDKRDHVLNPHHGWYGEAGITYHTHAFGSNYNYTLYFADVRKYFPFHDNSVLAMQGYAELTNGTVPWREQSRMGNATIMRGYFAGRYRDNQYAAAQVEYRKPVHRLFTLAAFVSAGQVQHNIDEFNLSDMRAAGGLGVRVMANKAKNIYLRFDFAASTDRTTGFYFKVGEAF